MEIQGRSVGLLARLRGSALQLPDRLDNPEPGCLAIDIAGIEKFIGAHRGHDRSILAVLAHHYLGTSPDIDFGDYDQPLSRF